MDSQRDSTEGIKFEEGVGGFFWHGKKKGEKIYMYKNHTSNCRGNPVYGKKRKTESG